MAIINVVKFDGNPNVLAWKHPNTALTTATRLMVNDSQEAVLFKDGVPCDVFGGGTHVLETRNIPLLQRIVNLPSGGESRFSAEVWYINKLVNLAIKWGTPAPMQILDPMFGVMIPVRANGQFGIQVCDSRTFLKKLVGTQKGFSTENVVQYFRGLYLSKVQDCIAGYIVHRGISVTQINAYISELSQYVEEQSAPMIAEYGLKLTSFFINSISIDQDDPMVQQIKQILVDRFRQNQLNFTWQEQQRMEALKTAASHSGTMSQTAGAAVNMANMFAGAELGKQLAKEMSDAYAEPARKFCPKCGAQIAADSAYCSKCGAKQE